MLELYMRLFEARSVNFESRGNAHGIGRDEILGAAALATKEHPVGNRIILSEMGDQHSITEMDKWVADTLPGLSDQVIAVVMGRPLPAQLEKLVFSSPYYDRARRKSKEYRVMAAHYEKKGDVKESARFSSLAKEVIDKEKTKVIERILVSGKCPKCLGAGKSAIKGAQCSVCHGTGGAIPDVKEIGKRYGKEIQDKFVSLVDVMQVDRNEWVNDFMRQINRERVA